MPEDNTCVHVINIDIQDNHEEATIGAFLICELLTVVSKLFSILYLNIKISSVLIILINKNILC